MVKPDNAFEAPAMFSTFGRRWLPAVTVVVSSGVLACAQAQEVRLDIVTSGLQNPGVWHFCREANFW